MILPIWPMGSWSSRYLKRWVIWPRFPTPKSVIFLRIKKLQQIHRNAFGNPPPIPKCPFIWAVINTFITHSYYHLSSPIIVIIFTPLIMNARGLQSRTKHMYRCLYTGWLRSWKVLEMFLEKKMCSWFFSIVRCSWNVLEKIIHGKFY